MSASTESIGSFVRREDEMVEAKERMRHPLTIVVRVSFPSGGI
jgi:hypothetical protein